MEDHTFTKKIEKILQSSFGDNASLVFQSSLLIQNLNKKTRSAQSGVKTRSSFANIYALYVLIEDYIEHGFDQDRNYSDYEGAVFSDLFRRQRELPFGEKLQNHALNDRLNGEFKKFFPSSEFEPIMRDIKTNRYWINENLLLLSINGQRINIARALLAIIDEYVTAKRTAFETFLKTCEEIQLVHKEQPEQIKAFIYNLLAPNMDARIFEIVSYAILKSYYHEQVVYFGFEREKLTAENLNLYKTGRTNANDGGIDFVMRPLGRFFQVTETLDVRKYFLDIDKVEHFPITFVIKSEQSVEQLSHGLEEKAKKHYPVTAIVTRYMSSIEEIISIPRLTEILDSVIEQGHLMDVLEEIVRQSKIEFNYADLNPPVEDGKGDRDATQGNE